MYLIHCDLFVVSIYHRESSFSSAKLICRKNTVCELMEHTSIECQSWHLPTVSECTNIFFFFFMSKATKTEEYLIKIALEFTASSPRLSLFSIHTRIRRFETEIVGKAL